MISYLCIRESEKESWLEYQLIEMDLLMSWILGHDFLNYRSRSPKPKDALNLLRLEMRMWEPGYEMLLEMLDQFFSHSSSPFYNFLVTFSFFSSLFLGMLFITGIRVELWKNKMGQCIFLFSYHWAFFSSPITELFDVA